MSLFVYSYSLTHTELFLRSLLDGEPVKTVVAPQAPRTDHHRANSKEREMVYTDTGRERSKMRWRHLFKVFISVSIASFSALPFYFLQIWTTKRFISD